MTARYDSEARSLAIGLAPDTRHQHTDEVATNVIVGVRDGHAVMVEVVRSDVVGLDGLDAAAERYALDREALHAAADAALAAPDRQVQINVLERAA
jgi:hypothetical protein